MNYRIVFSDIDGTLLTPAHVVSPFTKQTVLATVSKGIPFILVSARSRAGIAKVAAEIGLHTPMICFNGALIINEESQPIFELGMPMGDAIAIKQYINQHFPEIACNLYTQDKMIVDDATHPFVTKECAITSEIPLLFSDMYIDDYPFFYKILCLGKGSQIDALQKAITAAFPQYANCKSDETYLEVFHPAVNKGAGLVALCEKLAIPPQNAIAFGDQQNDIPMLKAAGLGVAMGNATPNVKAASGTIALPNWEDGLAHMLKKLFCL